MHDGLDVDTSLAGKTFQPIVGNQEDLDLKDSLRAIGGRAWGTLGSSVTFSHFCRSLLHLCLLLPAL